MSGCSYSNIDMWLWSIWVKTPKLNNSDILIVSACLPHVNKELFDKIASGKQVLFACPERESSAYYGKIASIIRSSKPKSITIVTIDGSPHCFQLHAAANEAAYIVGKEVIKKHYVVVDGKNLIEISPNSIRIARYLHIVERLINMNPEILNELKKHSLEYINELKYKDGSNDT